MIVEHDNYKWSPGGQLCTRMTIFDNYVLEWMRVWDVYANPKPVSGGGGVLLNKPTTTGLLRFKQLRSKWEIGCVARGEKDEVETNKVEPYAECIITRTSVLKTDNLSKVQHADLFSSHQSSCVWDSSVESEIEFQLQIFAIFDRTGSRILSIGRSNSLGDKRRNWSRVWFYVENCNERQRGMDASEFQNPKLELAYNLRPILWIDLCHRIISCCAFSQNTAAAKAVVFYGE